MSNVPNRSPRPQFWSFFPKGTILRDPLFNPTCVFLRHLLWLTNPKLFLKSPLGPIYTKDGARAKKKLFFGQNLPKISKRYFSTKNLRAADILFLPK